MKLKSGKKYRHVIGLRNGDSIILIPKFDDREWDYKRQITKRRNNNQCVFCKKEFIWGEMKSKHVMAEHPDKIPFSIREQIILWYLEQEKCN